MGFVGQVMDSVRGIQIFYIIGLLIFVALFFIILIRTILIPKAELTEYKNAIFDKEDSVSSQEK